MSLRHLALAVRDEERSRRFYERYFGFDAKPSRRYPDGVLMPFDHDGFALALGRVKHTAELPAFFHFGFTAASTSEGARPARAAHRRRRRDRRGMGRACVRHREVRDPEGYVVEVFWEPDLAG